MDCESCKYKAVFKAQTCIGNMFQKNSAKQLVLGVVFLLALGGIYFITLNGEFYSNNEKLKVESDQLLENNQPQKGETVETGSGLKYTILESGSGPSPDTHSQVSVHYRGRLEDGTEFDSSYKRGQPAKFPLNGVIKGWTEALLLMKTGDKWELTIPPELGYGSRGVGEVIPPNSSLIFEVELLKIL